MKTFRVIIHESFEDDTIKEIVFINQNIEQILTLIEKLNGKSWVYLEIYYSSSPYHSLYIIGGPDMFSFSLRMSKNKWVEKKYNPDHSPSWRTFGLGYHNYEADEYELCDLTTTKKVVQHFCSTGEWLTSIPSSIKEF